MTEQPDNYMDEFRRFVEQEVNAISVGQDRTEMPKDMGLLIPSLDLQKATNRIVAKADQYYADFYRGKILEAENRPTHIMGKDIDEVCGILTMLDMERLAEMQLTMANLKKWQKLLAEEQKKTFEKSFKRLTAQFNSRGDSDE